MQIFTKSSPLKPTKVFGTYWKFAVERQEIFFRRFRGEPSPWTNDPIFLKHKFTNAYRATDRVSQFLIRKVIYNGEQTPEEVFFRCFVFKIFNRVSTWELLEKELGTVTFADYSLRRYDEILEKARRRGERIFSAAYIMPSHSAGFNNAAKHLNYLTLMEKMMADKLPSKLQEARSMADAFQLFRGFPLMGNFLAYQYATDINYSNLTDFSEMDFVMPGPGAKDGIRKCFDSTGGHSEADVIRHVAETQSEEFSRLGLHFRNLWGRPLQLIDCQNLFCEVDKYARVAHPEIRGITDRSRIKQKFTPNSHSIQYWFPPKWKINEFIGKSNQRQCAQLELLAK
jgi:hypothetical protein